MNKIGKWLSADGKNSDIVVSSRIRLARNIKGFPFEIKISKKDEQRLVEIVSLALENSSLSKQGKFYTQETLSPLKLQFLLERHLVSPDFINSKKSHRAVFITIDESQSIMVNEEDHLRFSVLTGGFDLPANFERILEAERKLEKELDFAYSEELGFLTACPTNVGTGMRASALFHLPGLVITREIERVLRGIFQIGLSVRGFYGEGTEIRGNFFQISNQKTLGVSEDEIIKTMEKIGNDLIEFEKKARGYLIKNLRAEIEDKIFRALGILINARLITSDEAVNLIAMLRLGVSLKVIPNLDLTTLNELLIITQPANLQIFYNQELTPEERDEKRAALIRETLSKSNPA